MGEGKGNETENTYYIWTLLCSLFVVVVTMHMAVMPYTIRNKAMRTMRSLPLLHAPQLQLHIHISADILKHASSN